MFLSVKRATAMVSMPLKNKNSENCIRLAVFILQAPN
ncbi:Uncharacterised protein [Acinetobacter baumannii]|nr:Uncharacterised protein [Acinetobacter baumannii]